MSTKTSTNRVGADEVAGQLALGPERRDERDQDDEAGVDHQRRDLGHPTDVLDPVGVGEAEVVVEPVADVVAVEQEGVDAERVQAPLDQVGDGRLAGTGQAGEPDDAGRWPFSAARASAVTSSACQWTFSERRSAKCNSPAPTVALVRRSMMTNPPMSRLSAYGSNTTGRSVAMVHTPISLSRSVLAGQVLEGVDVDLVLRRRDRDPDRPGADLQEVGPAGEHLVVVHPHDVGLELVGDVGRRVVGAQHVAAADVDLVGEDEGDRLAGDGLVEVAVEGDDARDGARPTRRQDADPVAAAHAPTDDRPAEPAEVEVRAVHPLHRQAERAVAPRRRRSRRSRGAR